MARQINRLNARKIASIAEPGWHPDGGNLYLQVSQAGTKSWIFRFTIDGKTRPMGLGSLNTVSLSEARQQAEEYRKLVRDKIDPIEHRKAETSARLADNAKAKTFRECAEAYIKAHRAEWKNPKHISQWENTLETYAYPKLGALAVRDIDLGAVLEVLEPIWETKTETATRLRQRIEKVLDLATTRGYRTGENPARWRGHLENNLSKPNKVKKVRNHPALPYSDIHGFAKELARQEGIAAEALELCILTAARTGEVINARWAEFDLENNIWTVPADRMKAGKEHRIPLCDRAAAIIQGRLDLRESDFVFPGAKETRPLSNMAMLQLLKRMDRADITVHGFRSTFRDWVAEMTNYPREIAEQALAHRIPDKAEAAYRRGDLFEKRRRLMSDWAAYIASPPAGNVVPINRAAEIAS